MKKKEFKLTRRQLLKAGMVGGAGLMLPLRFLPAKAFADPVVQGLNDPADVAKFVLPVPDALHPTFKYTPIGNPNQLNFMVGVGTNTQVWGLKRINGGTTRLSTDIFGYGQGGVYTWPGKTFEVTAGRPTNVQWQNNLNGVTEHLLPVDTTLHWCYSLHGYTNRSIANDGVPIVVHLHGGHTTDLFDGNPEQFFGPGWNVTGPQFKAITFTYQNDRPGGNLWYHDHALGITRLNVYAGMAGFYFVRDDIDTGTPDNPLGLPAWPYEKAYAIQDRMFSDDGQLFYPAFPGDPFYDEFIETPLPDDIFINGGPTALAEFFGDHMVVNGRAWPKENVEARHYRLHLLNGTDSRFMAIRFRLARLGNTEIAENAPVLPFYVVGSDQGLASEATYIEPTIGEPNSGYLLSEPGSRYDIVFDFSQVPFNTRVIMENLAADEPFGGDLPEPGDERAFACTNRIMAFDVVLENNDATAAAGLPNQADNFNSTQIGPYTPIADAVNRTRKVALFEGLDEFDRLQPLLGTAEPATDFRGRPINWPNTPAYAEAVLPDGTESPLIGQMEGSIAWHSPTTENPAVRTTEDWEVWNLTGDAHPIHLHLVHFDVIDRTEIVFDSKADDDGFISDGDVGDDGIYLVKQPTVQHNSVAGDKDTYGQGFRIVHPTDPSKAYGALVDQPDGYVENTPKDMVTALPGQITRIRATFDKAGRYVWHCHILSHEDHEMMRVLHVGGGA